MKHRITYLLHGADDAVDPKKLDVKKDSLRVPKLDAAKEWRATIGVSDLPQEIWLVLKQSHELHLRWASPNVYDAVSPLVSRVSPGLHVFFTPRKDATTDTLCPLLTKIFGDDLKCHSVKESFSSPPILSERFAMSAAFQYYQPLPSLHDLAVYVQQKLCSADDIRCHQRANMLNSATYIDMDFDTISHALIVNAFWSHGPEQGRWAETVRAYSPTDSFEVGILNTEKSTEAEELALGGFLTVIGEDTKPSPVRFSFPSRHHPLPKDDLSTFKTSFRAPIGLHPTYEIAISGSSIEPPAESCSLHAYLTLPSTIFIDRYQLSDELFLASQNLTSLRTLSGETDLEAPTWVVKKWGSAALVELAPPDANAVSQYSQWTATIPMHLRYLPPTDENSTMPGHRTIDIPSPAVFWACEAEEGLKMAVNPFDRVNLGYDGLFGPKTMFYHVPPQGNEVGSLMTPIQVPVINTAKSHYVEIGTAVAVIVGFLWVAWKLVGPVSSPAEAAPSPTRGHKKSK